MQVRKREKTEGKEMEDWEEMEESGGLIKGEKKLPGWCSSVVECSL